MFDFLKVKVTLKDKNGKPYDRFLHKGCGVAYESKHGKHDVICPAGIKFIWYAECLDKAFESRGIMYATAISYSYGDNWCCPQ